MDDNEELDYGAPPHLSVDGDDDPRLIAFLKERLASADRDDFITLTTEELIAAVKKRGRERLAKERNAA